jgi:hypothetical protein
VADQPSAHYKSLSGTVQRPSWTDRKSRGRIVKWLNASAKGVQYLHPARGTRSEEHPSKARCIVDGGSVEASVPTKGEFTGQQPTEILLKSEDFRMVTVVRR